LGERLRLVLRDAVQVGRESLPRAPGDEPAGLGAKPVPALRRLHQNRRETVRELDRDRLEEPRRRDPLRRGRMRRKNHQAARREERLQGGGEGVGQVHLGPVGRGEPVERASREFSVRKARPQALERGRHFGPAGLAEEGQLRGAARPLPEHDGLEVARGVDHRRVIGLREVVIVARHPEHRDHGDLPLPLQALRDGNGGEGLVDGVERTGEEARLLPGGDD